MALGHSIIKKSIDGFFVYSDLATASTPISYTASNPLKLTNDGLGAQTQNTYKPYNITKLWNAVTNQFDFSELSLGDELSIRFNIQVTTSATNQQFRLYLSMAIGGIAYTIDNGAFFFKTAEAHPIGFVIPISMSNTDTITKPAELMFVSSDNATIKMNSFYISTKRKY